MFSLLSFEFLALALITAVLLAVLRGTARHLVFLAANVVFLWGLLLGPSGTVSTVAFALLGFVLVRLIQRYPDRLFAVLLGGYVLLFVYMQNYDFLAWLLPAPARTSILATVGLSFLFFKIVHVMIEARSHTLGRMTLLGYLNYGFNMTTFMMGPIQRYQDFDEQWSGRTQALPRTFESHLDAVIRILVGLVKAYVLARMIEQFAIDASTVASETSIPALLVQIYAFYFFLYLNFAGYCDVVIGVGCLFGVRPPENFDKPFLARDISDFWTRFHRSLTNWLTDYVFSPAYKWALSRPGGATRPLLAMNGALLLTMIVSGLWHGTTASFALFGLAHGLFFVVYRTWEALLTRRMGKKGVRAWRQKRWVHVAGVVITFHAVALSLVFFRLDASHAFAVFQRLVGF
ncbi:MAG TPA: MBOAT family O-acyltransferase [Rhodothermales bacterium]